MKNNIMTLHNAMLLKEKMKKLYYSKKQEIIQSLINPLSYSDYEPLTGDDCFSPTVIVPLDETQNYAQLESMLLGNHKEKSITHLNNLTTLGIDYNKLKAHIDKILTQMTVKGKFLFDDDIRIHNLKELQYLRTICTDLIQVCSLSCSITQNEPSREKVYNQENLEADVIKDVVLKQYGYVDGYVLKTFSEQEMNEDLSFYRHNLDLINLAIASVAIDTLIEVPIDVNIYTSTFFDA